MKLWELKQKLEYITNPDALVCIGRDDDNFYDGDVVTGLLIQHRIEDKECVKVTIVGDPSVKAVYD